MYLRKLEPKDAFLMYEWMHDSDVTHDLRTDFSRLSQDDAELFILHSAGDARNVNLAIASDEDEYMGTVSLKNICDGRAEFAIVMRKCAMKKGYALFGMLEILKKAFNELGLREVYWCVSEKNTRAVRFYEKNRFNVTKEVPPDLLGSYEGTDNLRWYVCKEEDLLSEGYKCRQ